MANAALTSTIEAVRAGSRGTYGAPRVHAELADAHVFEYIEGFYNRQRRHSALGYISPVHFEARRRLEHTSVA